MEGPEGVLNCIDENKTIKTDPILIIIAMIAICSGVRLKHLAAVAGIINNVVTG